MTAYAGEDVEQSKYSSIAGGSANLYSFFGNHYGRFSEKWKSIYLKIQLYHLGIYPKDALSYHKDTYSTIFIAALFIISRTWKQPRCPSTEEWIKKM